MAEVFGAVTGGVGLLSLGLQLAESARKLKSFYERAKHMRSTLSDIAHDLETVALTLQELARHRQGERSSGALLERCALRCKEKADEIDTLVNRLGQKIDRFGVAGRAYAAIKQADASALLTELEQAKSSIMLALQPYALYGLVLNLIRPS